MQYPTGGKLLLSDGGGMKGAWMWGVRLGLLDRGMGPDHFDIELSSSAGSFNSAFALARQYSEGTRCWLVHMVKYWKRFSNDMDFLEKLLTKIEPLNYRCFSGKKTKVFVALSDPKSQSSRIFSLNHARDPIQLLLAAPAMQYFTGPRKVDDSTYFDAGLTNQPPFDHVAQFKPKEVWAIMASPAGHRIGGLESATLKVAGAAYCLRNLGGGRLILKCAANRNRILEAIEGFPEMKVIRPKEPLVQTRCTNPEAVLADFQKGRQAAEEFARNEKW